MEQQAHAHLDLVASQVLPIAHVREQGGGGNTHDERNKQSYSPTSTTTTGSPVAEVVRAESQPTRRNRDQV